MDRWMDGWVEGSTEIRLEPREVLRKRIQTTAKWTHTMLLSRLAQNTEELPEKQGASGRE